MINNTTKDLKKLRGEKNITQQKMANDLGISRASYIAIEQGRRKMSLDELKIIALVLGKHPHTLLGETGNTAKYKQMFFEFLRAGADKDGKIPKTKLAKLLYLADFAWYYEHLQSMSGMEYKKMQYGPVPKDYFALVDEVEYQGLITIEQKNSAFLLSINRSGEKEKTDLLTEKEKALIRSISKKWKDRNTKEIVSFTHNQLPYTLCDDGEIIPYELITQEDPKYVY